MAESSTQRVRPGSNRRLLGQILVERRQLNAEQLEQALNQQRQTADLLGRVLCKLGHLDTQTLREALVDQAGIARVSVEGRQPDAQTLAELPPEFVAKRKVLPLALQAGRISLAMADPFDRGAIDAVRALTGKRVERQYCPEPELMDAVRRLYGSSVARMIADLDVPAPGTPGSPGSPGTPGSDPGSASEESATHLQEMAREPSVVNLVNLILLEAIDHRASDVHVEPFDKSIKVKCRIDGMLQEMPPPPKRLQPAIVSRIKIMAGMNIAERFVPQDGHIAFHTPRGKVDIRVGTVPTIHGESVAMRLLDRSESMLDLEHLGLDEAILPHFAALLERPHGIVLVTGPTGSGKTTTLYAALSRIYTPQEKIITIEDPVEYQIEGVNQIAVNRKRGIDFASGLRAILRQDPDIIMIGEIRDRETADIAIRSALTGHLVFSTLHTNDAPGAVSRLLDMGIEPFLLASSLEGVLAQRLVRTICDACREERRPDKLALERLGAEVDPQAMFYVGRGCAQCRQTGYAGRVGIFELLRVTEPVRQVILKRGSSAEITSAAPADHRRMRLDGLRRALVGQTTLEEVLRVTQDTQTEDAESP
jgi:type II secretory ATPase GspE/PulE/Tfp pilus assembly ATPase PilB-like protein